MSPRRSESPTAHAADRAAAERSVVPAPGGPGTPRARAASTAGAPSLTVAAVARRLGVAPATLRTWDRRYGLGPSEHLAGSHRRYSTADVARLVVMRRLTLEGVAPSEAARSALATSGEDAASGVTGAHGGAGPGDQVIDAFSEAVPMAPDPPALVSAASHFDSGAMRWMLARVHPRDTIAWWTELVAPALRAVAGRSHLDRPGESVGAALTAAAFAELRSRGAVSAARAQNGRAGGAGDPEGVTAGDAEGSGTAFTADRAGVLALALGGGPPLLVHVLATALQARGVGAWVLSGDAHGGHGGLSGTLDKLRPAAVVLDADPGHDARDHDDSPGQDARVSATLQRLVELDPEVPVFVHRRGSARVDLPPSGMVHRVRTLTGALHEILAVTS